MKYLKRHKIFEDITDNPAYGIGKIEGSVSTLNYLSPDKLEESIKTFEDILVLVYPFIDDQHFDVKFETVYGSSCTITHQDYKDKNSKWVIFINGLPFRYKLTIILRTNTFDISVLSDTLGTEYDDFLEKSKSLGWEHEESSIYLNPNSTSYRDSMNIKINLKKIS